MKVSRELLWKAWPDGYLAVRGVSTVGGWHCLDNDAQDERGALFAQPDASRLTMVAPSGVLCNYGRAPQLDVTAEREAIKQGDLLPNVDPTDTATWACLLQDLAEGLMGGLTHDRYDQTWSHTDTGWRMFWQHRENSSITGWHTFTDIDTDDPAEALVLARIQLREKRA